MSNYSRRHPFRDFWFPILLMIAIPLIFWQLYALLLNYYQPQFMRLNPASARFLGFGTGTLFHMCCVIGGLLRKPWQALLFRLKEFFANLVCSPGFAFSCYWEDLRLDGPWFVGYMTVILACLYGAIEAGVAFFSRL